MNRWRMTVRVLKVLFAANILAFAQSEPSLEDKGKDIFRACSGCHNVLTDARKSAPSLRTLFGKVRLINGKRTSPESVRELITEGYNRMPSYRYLLRPKDWEELMAYLMTLRARPEISPVLKPIRGSDEDILSAGKKLYDDECAGCHSKEGSGAPDVLKVYSREKLATGEPVEEETIIPRIRQGHGGMPPKAEALDDAALFSLIAYLKAQ